MRFDARSPRHPALEPFVTRLWHFGGEFTHGAERLIPSIYGQLLINLDTDGLSADAGRGLERYSGAVFSGPRSTPLTIGTAQQRDIVGVQFRTGGFRAFMPLPAEHLADAHVEADDVWGVGGAHLRERLCEARVRGHLLDTLEVILCEHLCGPDRMAADVRAGVAALVAGTSVAETCARLGHSPRRLLERFRDQVGLTPKRLARVARLNRVVAGCSQPPGWDRRRASANAPQLDLRPTWATLAAECGYADQAHLIREFRVLAGITPTEFVPRSATELTHIPIR